MNYLNPLVWLRVSFDVMMVAICIALLLCGAISYEIVSFASKHVERLINRRKRNGR